MLSSTSRPWDSLGDAHPEAPAAAAAGPARSRPVPVARPAPAAPIIGPAPPLARVIGPAPPAGFVRAAKCPALDRDRVDVQVDAVALADENALGALLQRATRTVGLLLWATVSEADNVAQGPFRLPVLRFEEVRTGRTVALVVRGSGELPTRKDALRYAAAAAATAPEVDALLAAHAAPASRKDAARARGAAEPVRLLEQLSRERSGGGRRASRTTGLSGAPRTPRPARARRRAAPPATKSSSPRSSRCARSTRTPSPRPSRVRHRERLPRRRPKRCWRRQRATRPVTACRPESFRPRRRGTRPAAAFSMWLSQFVVMQTPAGGGTEAAAR